MSELENYMINEKQIQQLKYQYMTYFKQNYREIVNKKDFTSIDFLKAMYEMEKLNWKKFNHIGFINHRTEECVQFIREGKNEWYADVPIIINGEWNGYSWSAYSDNKTIANMLRLFFEEVEWFGMLSWKMRRYKK